MRVFVQRWVYFVVGGALCTPYALFALLAVPLTVPVDWQRQHVREQAVLLPVLLLGLIAATALIPFVRAIEGAVAPVLLGGHAAGLEVAPARTPGARGRGAAWFVAHTVGGAAISLATVLGLPISVVLLTSTWRGGGRVELGIFGWAVPPGAAVPLGLAIPVLLVAVVAASGRLAAWLAPVLLGPDPVARLEELERRSARLVERNRLAQELHDSLGHALTVTALQAAAARRVLHDDPAFADQALEAISRTSRTAAADLDNVLGMLRNDPAARVPQPDLTGLDALVAGHREAGLPLEVEVTGDLTHVPGAVSREVYRIVQEGLTNVARHAGRVPTSLRIELGPGELTARLHNPVPAAPHRRPGAGGRGLAGMRERVALLGGRLAAGPDAGAAWLVDVRVPTGASR